MAVQCVTVRLSCEFYDVNRLKTVKNMISWFVLDGLSLVLNFCSNFVGVKRDSRTAIRHSASIITASRNAPLSWTLTALQNSKHIRPDLSQLLTEIKLKQNSKLKTQLSLNVQQRCKKQNALVGLNEPNTVLRVWFGFALRFIAHMYRKPPYRE